MTSNQPASPAVTASSWDVFDTCIVRPFARPEDLFLALAHRLLGAEVADGDPLVQEVAAARVDAERRARESSDREEITLEEVYAALPVPLPWGFTAPDMMRAELALEEIGMEPVSTTRRAIDLSRRQGRRQLFVSDTYLPGELIERVLRDRGLAHEGDGIYVSSEIGLTKASGAIWAHVLEHEGLSAGAIHHTGDHPRADVRVPRSRGIAVTAFEATRLNRYERRALSVSGRSALRRSRIAGIGRLARLAVEEGDPEAAEIGSATAAPLFVAFAAWMLRDALEHGVESLHFMARDGQILMAAAEAIAEHLEGAPNLRYLYGSRRVWTQAAVEDCTREGLGWLFRAGHSHEPADLLAQLGLDLGELPPSSRHDDFWTLVEDPTVRELVRSRAAALRERVEAYLGQEGIEPGGRWALVDIGWAMSSQRAIRSLMADSSDPPNPRGWYVGARRTRLPASAAGPYRAFLLEDGGPADAVFRRIMLVEELFARANHGLVQDFAERDGRWEPVLAERPASAAREFIAGMHAAVRRYATEAAAAGLLEGDVDDLREHALWALEEFFSNPSRREAEVASRVRVQDPQNREAAATVAAPVELSDLPALVRNFAAPGSAAEPLWLEGSLARSPAPVRWSAAGARAAKRRLLRRRER